MMVCCGVFLSKGAGPTDWYFFFLLWIQIGIAIRGQLWNYTDFSFVTSGHRFGLGLHLAWCFGLYMLAICRLHHLDSFYVLNETH